MSPLEFLAEECRHKVRGHTALRSGSEVDMRFRYCYEELLKLTLPMSYFALLRGMSPYYEGFHRRTDEADTAGYTEQ